MSGLPDFANPFDRSGPLSVKAYEADCPDDQLVLYRNHNYRSELYPNGVECLIHVPKARLVELGREPGYFHGEVINVRAGGRGAVSNQGALFTPPASREVRARSLKYLGGLDVRFPTFVRMAAARISALDTAKAVEAALNEVPPEFLKFVETLAISGLAVRVARAVTPRIREILLAEVPEALRPRVEPLAKSYAVVRPWERRGDA